MKHAHYTDVAAEEVGQGASGAKIRWLIKDGDGAKVFHMRHFELAPGGFTPHHEHAWEHEIFILRGNGTAVGPSGEKPFRPGDVLFIPGGDRHQMKNTSSAPVEFLCLIPAPK